MNLVIVDLEKSLNTAMDEPFKTIRVAVGVIERDGALLISQRANDKHCGGLWEFPGGKIEPGESVADALNRELQEELGISCKNSSPLIYICHDYPDCRVQLHVRRVEHFEGTPHGVEQQPIAWVGKTELSKLAFPKANIGIIRACQLPMRYLILPNNCFESHCWSELEQVLATGFFELIRYRKTQDVDYASGFPKLEKLATQYKVKLIVDDTSYLAHPSVVGLHLTEQRLMALEKRPVEQDKLLIASTHSKAAILHANQLGCDAVCISPVKHTQTHPNAVPIGWSGFETLSKLAQMPSYALGGLSDKDIEQAKNLGGQGIAAIRGFLSNLDTH